MNQHVENCGDRVGEDAEQNASFKAALVPASQAVERVCGMAGLDHGGAFGCLSVTG